MNLIICKLRWKCIRVEVIEIGGSEAAKDCTAMWAEREIYDGKIYRKPVAYRGCVLLFCFENWVEAPRLSVVE
jgi:hypothetical protein